MLLDWVKQQLSRKKSSQGSCCLSFTAEGIAFACRKDTNPDNTIDSYGFVACTSTELSGVLREIVRQYDLQSYTCSYLLTPEKYRLLLIDAPQVPENEQVTAARWVIKDLIDFPAEEALLDLFLIPSVQAQAKKAYAVVTRSTEIQPLIDIIESAGLNLTNITITELALGNILTALSLQSANIALMSLKPDNSFIAIYKNENLYLSRQLRLTQADLDNFQETGAERLVLEIQRSLDYSNTQLRLGSLNKAFLLPLPNDPLKGGAVFSEQLTTPVKLLDVSTLLAEPESDASMLAYCVPVIGGALRDESEN